MNWITKKPTKYLPIHVAPSAGLALVTNKFKAQVEALTDQPQSQQKRSSKNTDPKATEENKSLHRPRCSWGET